MGNQKALDGLLAMTGERDYQSALAGSRNFVLAIGVMPKKNYGGSMAPGEVGKVLQKGVAKGKEIGDETVRVCIQEPCPDFIICSFTTDCPPV